MTGAALPSIERHGRIGGTPLVYLHGAPGAPREAQLIAAAAAAAGVELWAINRAAIGGTAGDAYLDALAAAVRALGGGQPLPILGFSIGAALALRVAARLGRDAGPLFLLAAAGPLDVPGAFDGMGAGARVFRAAQAGGAPLSLTVAAQAALARHAPGLLRRLLFAGAEAGDAAFAASPAGRPALAKLLTAAWADGGGGYRRDLITYVAPWAGELAAVTAPVTLWHGTADTWAPPAMARGLAERLPDARLQLAPGGHYATLIGQAPAAFAAATQR